MAPKKLLNFCFTKNNWTETDKENLKKLDAQYHCFGIEVGESGTPHLQGYAELKKQTGFSSVKAILEGFHMEARKGTQEEAITYCKKDGQFEEHGSRKQQGARADLDEVRNQALEIGIRNVSCYSNLQEIKVAEKFLEYNEPQRDWFTEVIWITGPSGSGKSRLAKIMTQEEDVYYKGDTKWWNGYDGHKSIIINDFRDSWWSLTYMLNLLDRYPFRVETKGGMRQMRATKIIITSIKHPKNCYAVADEDSKQLKRRISCIKDLTIKKEIDLAVAKVGGNTKPLPILNVNLQSRADPEQAPLGPLALIGAGLPTHKLRGTPNPAEPHHQSWVLAEGPIKTTDIVIDGYIRHEQEFED